MPKRSEVATERLNIVEINVHLHLCDTCQVFEEVCFVANLDHKSSAVLSVRLENFLRAASALFESRSIHATILEGAKFTADLLWNYTED